MARWASLAQAGEKLGQNSLPNCDALRFQRINPPRTIAATRFRLIVDQRSYYRSITNSPLIRKSSQNLIAVGPDKSACGR
jgi:hypothetical protein